MAKEWLKTPSMVIYWADSKLPLSYAERAELIQSLIQIIDIGPREVLLEHPKTGRTIVIRGITDPNVPQIPGHTIGRA